MLAVIDILTVIEVSFVDPLMREAGRSTFGVANSLWVGILLFI